MTWLTAAKIAELAPHVASEIAERLATSLEGHMPAFGLVDGVERAHFIAQACHETGGFAHFEENLHYRDPKRLDAMFSAVRGEDDAAALIAKGPQAVANRAYAYRNGNGSEQSGDGWRFRGRGLFQLTGRDSYMHAAGDLERPYVEHPDLVAQPEGAVLTALWFWKKNGCPRKARADDVEGVTRIINGPGMAGLEERRTLTERAKSIFAAVAMA
jgi:putative chitinase